MLAPVHVRWPFAHALPALFCDRRYGLACRIIDPKVEMTDKLPKEQQHWFKFQHPCYWVCKEGHPDIGPPGTLCPLHTRFGMHGVVGRGGPCPSCLEDMIVPCTNMDPDHRRCGALLPRTRTHAQSQTHSHLNPQLARPSSCFRHPEDDAVVEEVIDETADELDQQVP